MFRLFKFIENSKATKEELQQMYDNKLNEEVQDSMKMFDGSTDNVHKYCHSMRDRTCEIGNAEIASSNMLETTCINICNDVERVLQSIWKNHKISVCIKQLDDSSCNESDFKKWKLITIARSGGSKTNRNENNSIPVTIGDNSDFEVIVSPEFQDSIFACKDLTQIDKEFFEKYKKEYRNSTKNYIDLYKSTIVAPIRVQASKASKKINNARIGGNYHLVGFLCVDTAEIFTEDDILFSMGINYTKSFADILYTFFENVIISFAEGKEQ